MKLSLRQARRLEREIETQVSIVTGNLNTRNVAISMYEGFEQSVHLHQQKILDAVLEIKKLNKIRYAIRLAIQGLHQESGLNQLMNREVQVRAELTILENAIGPEFTDAEYEIARKKHASIVTSDKTSTDAYGRLTDQVSVHFILTKRSLDLLKGEQKLLKKELLRIADESSVINSTSVIEVADDDLVYLETLNIVV